MCADDSSSLIHTTLTVVTPRSQVDDDDLGLHVVVQERPEEYLTDSSFARMKCGIALDTYEQYREPPHTGNIPYDEILRIGRRMKELLKRYELYQVDSNPRRRRCVC